MPLEAQTRLVGASESGKSALIEAVCFALLGRRSDGGRFPIEWIRQGHPAASVELAVRGVAVRRTVDREGKVVRSVDGAGISSEREFASRLGLPDPTLLRVILAPLQWPALAAANARALRDLLGSLLPPGDPVAAVEARLVAAGFRLSEPAEARLPERVVSRLRRDARSGRDQAQGRADTLAERLDALGPAQVASTPVDDGVLERQSVWEAYDRAEAERGRAEARRVEAAARCEAWEARRVDLGEPPKAPDGQAIDTAQQAEAQARRSLDEAREAWRALQDRFHRAAAELTALESASAGTCPTCGAEWDKARRALANARGVVEGLDLEKEELALRGRRTREAHELATTVLRDAREGALRRHGWERALRALGPRPQVPSTPEPPAPPAVPRPSAADLGPAVARGASLQRERDRVDTAARLTAARERLTAAQTECARLDVLLAAVREVPSELAAQQVAALGALGPVSLVFGDNPAVEVRIDGRPWWLASRGRQVVADLWLRAALRRVLGEDWPLFVDNVQDVAGQSLPDPGGPAVWLRTADGPLVREG
ncbi:MAG: hypothetical protein ACI8PZ_001010 [Myxococcota bacterium]|jgi:hypothetical protein